MLLGVSSMLGLTCGFSPAFVLGTLCLAEGLSSFVVA